MVHPLVVEKHMFWILGHLLEFGGEISEGMGLRRLGTGWMNCRTGWLLDLTVISGGDTLSRSLKSMWNRRVRER